METFANIKKAFDTTKRYFWFLLLLNFLISALSTGVDLIVSLILSNISLGGIVTPIIISLLYIIVILLLNAFIRVGTLSVYLEIFKSKTASLEMFFKKYKLTFKMFLIQIVSFSILILFILSVSLIFIIISFAIYSNYLLLLLIIPLIFLAYISIKYLFGFYFVDIILVSENISVMDCFRKSLQITKNNIGKLIKLILAIISIGLLCIIIASLFLVLFFILFNSNFFLSFIFIFIFAIFLLISVFFVVNMYHFAILNLFEDLSTKKKDDTKHK
ncbi:MAG: hypothetical protein QW524_03200 [Candidatus Woesearchaeota archaeon]